MCYVYLLSIVAATDRSSKVIDAILEAASLTQNLRQCCNILVSRCGFLVFIEGLGSLVCVSLTQCQMESKTVSLKQLLTLSYIFAQK